MHLLDLNAPGSHLQSFINIGIACLERTIQKKRKKINSYSTGVLMWKQRENSQQVLRNFLGLCLRVWRAITIIHAFLSVPTVSKKLLLKRGFDFYVYNQFKVQAKDCCFIEPFGPWDHIWMFIITIVIVETMKNSMHWKCRQTIRCIQQLHKKIASLHGFTVAMEQPYVTF